MQEVIEGNAETSQRCRRRSCRPISARGSRTGVATSWPGDGCCSRSAGARAVRHCHGDLHLGNIVLLEGRPVLFDCLEFDEALASTDTLYDLAFLLMDLQHQASGRSPSAC